MGITPVRESAHGMHADRTLRLSDVVSKSTLRCNMLAIGDQIGLTLDRIVLATDFSPISEKAAGYAQGLARHFSSSLSVANVIDLSEFTRCADVLGEVPINNLRALSSEFQEKTIQEMCMVGVRSTGCTLESYDPAAALVELADNLRADLIVTGTNARHGLDKFFLGSCAEGIIRHAPCPVLTVGPEARNAPKKSLSFDTILFATDFSPESARQAALAFSLARETAAKIYLCHIIESQDINPFELLELQMHFEKALSKLIPRNTYDFFSPECVVESGSVAPRILELASLVKADLIVLGASHSPAWWRRIVDGAVQKVLAHAQCPVMTVGAAGSHAVASMPVVSDVLCEA
jgi:nucleotide-binding universal stress UspA family protein